MALPTEEVKRVSKSSKSMYDFCTLVLVELSFSSYMSLLEYTFNFINSSSTPKHLKKLRSDLNVPFDFCMYERLLYMFWYIMFFTSYSFFSKSFFSSLSRYFPKSDMSAKSSGASYPLELNRRSANGSGFSYLVSSG